jgi:hypothetical protein
MKATNNNIKSTTGVLPMVVHIKRDFVDHDRIVTSKKIVMIFTEWILCHTWQRKPQLTNKRRQVLEYYIQSKGYSQIITTIRFISSTDPHATWLRENGYTFFDNIFNDHKWDIRYRRADKYFKKERK